MQIDMPTRLFFAPALWVVRIIACVFIMMFILTSPASAHGDHGGDDLAFAQASSVGPSVVSRDDLADRSIGLSIDRVKTVDAGDLDAAIQATGEVQASENESFDINCAVSGVVQSVFARQGDMVRKGQVLATIFSPEVAAALGNLINEKNRVESDIARLEAQYKADVALQKNQLDLAQVAFDREKDLLLEGISARKNYQTAETELKAARVRLEALQARRQQEILLARKQLSIAIAAGKDQLAIMGFAPARVDGVLARGHVSAELDVVSPRDGYVVTRNVTPGERVDQTKKMFAIINLSRVWVMVDIYQEQIGQIREGARAEIKTPTGSIVQGTVSSVGSTVDAQTRTSHLRIVVPNDKQALRPGMFVTARVFRQEQTEGSSPRVLAIPGSALVKIQDRDYVYRVSPDGDRYEPVAVKVGRRGGAGTLVEIVSGLTDGQQIVVSGVAQLSGPIDSKKHQAEDHDDHQEHEQDQILEEARNADTRIAGLTMFLAGGFCMAIVGLVVYFFGKRRGARPR